MHSRQSTLTPGTPWRGTDNLRGYIFEAVLPLMKHGPDAPPMPPPGHKSHLNVLSVRPEPYRRLESMHRLKGDLLDKSVHTWLESYIPHFTLGVEDEDEATGECLSIPAPCFSVPTPRLMRPDDINRLAMWLDCMPMATVQRVLHLVFSEMRDYKFSLNDEKDVDGNILKHYLWTQPSWNMHSDVRLSQGSVIILVQPPWILSPRDLERFVECRSLSPFLPGEHQQQPIYRSKERLWGKLWDLCVRKRCSWWVVSTYVGWVFGAFSKGWTTAFVSPVYGYDSYQPSVVECLIYWLISAKGLQGGWEIPKMAEPCNPVNPSFSIPSPIDDSVSLAAPSESSWAGKSSAPGSSAGVEGVFSPVLSDTGLPGRHRPLFEQEIEAYDRVRSWTHSENATPWSSPLVNRTYSPAPSDASSSSTVTTTVKENLSDNRCVGDWLV